jgi:hypothetical protein
VSHAKVSSKIIDRIQEDSEGSGSSLLTENKIITIT